MSVPLFLVLRAKYICASAFGGEKMQCTSTRQFERQELCSPKPSVASGVCKLLVRTERRSSSALNAAHDDKQSISLMYASGCLLNSNVKQKKMNKFSVMLKKSDVYVRIELRHLILAMKTTTSGVYTLNPFIYLMNTIYYQVYLIFNEV